MMEKVSAFLRIDFISTEGDVLVSISAFLS
jgi:hypothetical protein